MAMRVRREVVLEVGPEQVWAWLSQLDKLAAVNMFHGAVRFEGATRSGLGTRLWVRHGLKLRNWMPFSMEREARLTHWQEGVAVGWVEIDPVAPRSRFPHSQTFRLEPIENYPSQTRLVNELRGSLNLPFGRLGKRIDGVFGRWWVGWVLGRECRTLKREIEKVYGLAVVVRAKSGNYQ